jgi:hypothetical protein
MSTLQATGSTQVRYIVVGGNNLEASAILRLGAERLLTSTATSGFVGYCIDITAPHCSCPNHDNFTAKTAVTIVLRRNSVCVTP